MQLCHQCNHYDVLMRWEGNLTTMGSGSGDCMYMHCTQTVLTRQPLPRDSHAAAGIGSKLYMWGGDGGSSKIKSTALEIFVVTSVQWEQQKALRGYDMSDGLEGMAVTSDGETAYCCCGRTGSYPNEDACMRWRCLHDSSSAEAIPYCKNYS